jgi:hypothetical protein
MRETGKGFVYVIFANNSGGESFYKIGSSRNNPEGRLRQLQTGCPHRLELLSAFYLDSYQEIERYLHGKLKDHNSSGEWFVANDFTGKIISSFADKNHKNAVAKIYNTDVLTFGMVEMARIYLIEKEEIDKKELEALERYYGEWKESVANG